MKTWPTKKLGEVCDVYQPQTITSNEVLKEGPFKVFGANGVIGYYSKYNHEDAEVLITCRGATCGTVNMSEPKSWITGNAMVVHPKGEKVLSKAFLFYVLKRSNFLKTITGTGQPQITRNSLAPFQIPLPPLKTQKQIVERLDKIAEAQKLNNDLIQKSDELFQSLLHQELNLAGKDWEVKKLKDIAEILGGFAFKSNDLIDKKIAEDYLPVIKIGNVLKNGDLDTLNVQYHRFNGSLEKYLINSGDILVAMTGATVGKVVSSPANNLLLNQRVGLIRSHSETADQRFLGTILETRRFYEYCQKTAGGGAQGNISPTQIMLYETILPPLKNQKQIIAKLSTAQEYKTQLLVQKSKLKEFFNSVLAKSFSGNL